MLEQDVVYDIEQNANSEPFVVAESEATDSAAVEPEKVAGEVVENDENVPDFMKDQEAAMRVISQDGRLDFPYENSVVFITPRDASEVRIQAIGDDDDGMIAKYSTGEKAKKAMEMLRIAYGNNEFYHHTANSEHFTEFTQALSEEMFKKATTEYFQFPTEEELEQGMGKVLFGLIAYIPWLAWMIGFHIYKKIRRGEVWESDVFIPVMWILIIFGQFLYPILQYLY